MNKTQKETEDLKTEISSLKIRIRRIEQYLLGFPSPEGFIHESTDEYELLETAADLVRQYDRASASLLQRRLVIGYARAARLLDQLEDAKVVGPGNGGEPRQVLKSKKKKG